MYRSIYIAQKYPDRKGKDPPLSKRKKSIGDIHIYANLPAKRNKYFENQRLTDSRPILKDVVTFFSIGLESISDPTVIKDVVI